MKRRNREVNIFNMSLLDILCGALGAFCFMMLSLLPYYRPPGKDIRVSQEQKELLDEIQKIKDLTERLKSASTAEDLSELVEQLKRQIALLENQIKQLQGQVNALYAENEELRTRVAKLEVENGQLRTRNEKLEQENQQLRARNQQLEQEKQQLLAEKQQLQREKEQLEQEKRKLENRLQQQIPWTVTVAANDPRLSLDCSLHEQSLAAEDNSRQPDFDPALAVQPTMWTGDLRLGGAGSVTRVVASRSVGSESKFYVKVNPQFSRSGPVVVRTDVAGNKLAPVRALTVALPPERSWVLVGRFRVESPNRITLIEATDAEREAEWMRYEKATVPKTTETTPGSDPQLTDAVMGPGFEKRRQNYENMTRGNPPPPVREAMLQLWQAEAGSEKERQHVRALLARLSGGPGPSPTAENDPQRVEAAAKRKADYLRALNDEPATDKKNALLRKWMTEAASSEERDMVRQMLQRQNPAPTSPLLRGLEEPQKKPETPR